jgi:flagellar biosynthesis protein FlhF
VYANTEHPSLKQLRVILEKNDFSSSYTEKLLGRVKAELSLQTLDVFYETQQQVLEWIGESITLCKAEPTIFAKKPAIIIIIGPTGAGKTTTVAKLAANFYFAKREVVLITIDFFKLSAKEQLQEYGRILKIPTLVAYNKSDVERELALRADGVDIIIVDTIGNSPKETARIGDMQDTLSGCGKNAQTFLVIPASMKTRDIIELMKQYEPFSYSSVIVTKIDETSNTGSIISALEERGKSVSYITFGQKVPGFLKEATVQDFLMRLDDFDIDRARLEKKWGAAE